MTELERALSAIHSIRHQVARGTQFRGYGPASIAFSGFLALSVAFAEDEWGVLIGHALTTHLIIWICVAAISLTVSSLETLARARRVHSEFADDMLYSAVEQFLPALTIGVLLTAVLVRVAPEDCWLLPGLWSLIFSLGVFASCRFLPPHISGVGVWYLLAGLGALIAGSGPKAFLPWAMGIPFGVGQLLVAGVLHFSFAGHLEEA